MRLAAVAAHFGRDVPRALDKMAGIIGDARQAGVDLLVFPDATLEESTELASACAAADMTAALLIAPTTPAERAEKIAVHASWKDERIADCFMLQS